MRETQNLRVPGPWKAEAAHLQRQLDAQIEQQGCYLKRKEVFPLQLVIHFPGDLARLPSWTVDSVKPGHSHFTHLFPPPPPPHSLYGPMCVNFPFFVLFHFSFLATLQHVEIPGQGSDPSHSFDL